MLRFYWLALFGCTLALAGGCRSTDSCPPGEHRMLGTNDCVVDGADGSVPDAGFDAGPPPDAGPCSVCSDTTPLCRVDDGECVSCLGDDDCAAGRCDVEAGQCVGCLGDSDCTEPDAARCDLDTRECAPCTDSTQCDGIAGRGVCGDGECVECTADEPGVCGANACRPDQTCSDYPAGQVACQPCDTDANCIDGQLCLEMTYGDPPPERAVGRFCQWRKDAPLPGPNGTCGLTSRPFAETVTAAMSVDGVTADLCTVATTTCPALLQHRTTVPGCETPFEDDAACGASGFNDGRCRNNSAGEPHCTYPCGGIEDCRSGFTCPAAGDQYCSI